MRNPNEELPITTVKILEVYRRFRESKVLRGTSGILDDEIFGLICEEDAIEPYDVEWWNAHYDSVFAAATDIKSVWQLLHEPPRKYPAIDEPDEGMGYSGYDGDAHL